MKIKLRTTSPLASEFVYNASTSVRASNLSTC